MASRQWRRVRIGILVAATVTAAAGVVPTSAVADPGSPATNSSDPVQQYKDLSAQADKLNEDLLAAQNDLATKQTQLQQADTGLAQAKQAEQQATAVEEQFRTQVDRFTGATFEGARLNQLSALLSGTSTRDFLDRATLLNEVAQSNNAALTNLAGATTRAAAAQRKAQAAQRQIQDATTTAAQLVSQITGRKQALAAQITVVKGALGKLTAPQRTSLNNVGDTGVFIGPPGAVGIAMQAALGKRGDKYVWGAAGPNQFDCSGLTLWAYGQAGISLPHSSRAQYDLGKSVASGQWQPGDLLFYGSSTSNLHHVAMYVGNGKIVQAPTEGVPVQVVPISGGGSDYFGAKRIVG